MKCPGQDTRYWKPGDIFEIPCPGCGAPIEFFKDESTRRCRNCHRITTNPRMDFGCAAYCKYAEQCIGELGPELLKQRKDLLKDRVAIEMKKSFGRDFKSISHAVKTARYAEEIGREEKADLAVVLTASYLHRMDEAKARAILDSLSPGEDLTEEVLGLMRDARREEGHERLDVRVLMDALSLADLDEQVVHSRPGAEAEGLPGTLRTSAGRKIAEKALRGSKDAARKEQVS